MRYDKVTVIKKVDSGTIDALGNITYDTIEIPILARLTEWTAEDVDVYGRELTTGGRKMLVKPFYGIISMQDQIRMGEDVYSVVEAKDLGRWILLIVKGYRL